MAGLPRVMMSTNAPEAGLFMDSQRQAVKAATRGILKVDIQRQGPAGAQKRFAETAAGASSQVVEVTGYRESLQRVECDRRRPDVFRVLVNIISIIGLYR